MSSKHSMISLALLAVLPPTMMCSASQPPCNFICGGCDVAAPVVLLCSKS